jgi:hypothetical protein
MTRVKPAVPLLGGILRNIDGVTGYIGRRQSASGSTRSAFTAIASAPSTLPHLALAGSSPSSGRAREPSIV